MDHSLTTSCLTCCIFVAFVRVPLSTSKQEGFSMFFFSLEFAISSPQESGMKTQGLGLRHPDQFLLSLRSLRVETDAHVETFLFQCFDTASLNRQISPPRRPKPNFGDRIRCLGDENLGTKVLFAMFWQGRTDLFQVVQNGSLANYLFNLLHWSGNHFGRNKMASGPAAQSFQQNESPGS